MDDVIITDFGACDDGHVHTREIQKAIDLCPAGGAVIVPAGTYLTGALELKSDMTLRIDKNARLLGSPDTADYPIRQDHHEGREQLCYSSLISTGPAPHRNITIEGKGCIDANGIALFPREMEEGRAKRGKALSIRNTEGLTIRGITVRNAAFWCVHILYCHNILVDGVSVHTACDSEGRKNTLLYNGDGIDLECCQDALVENCLIESQDDCLAVKSGRDADGRRVGIPSARIRVRNCRFRHGFGVAVGSEMSGGIRDVEVSGCEFSDSFSIASVKCRRGRGNAIRDISFRNCVLTNTDRSIRPTRWFKGILYIDSSYGETDFDPEAAMPADETTPEIRDLSFESIEGVSSVGYGLYVCGLKEMPVRGVTLKNVRLKAEYDSYIVNAGDVRMENTVLEGKPGNIPYREQAWFREMKES